MTEQQQQTERRCAHCAVTKPVTEFYADRTRAGGLSYWCRICHAGNADRPHVARLIRNRARQRATSRIVARHAAEFRAVFDEERAAAVREVRRLADRPEADHYGDTDLVRLRPGPRLSGETVEDRIDVARCRECVRHHDRGHICAACGTAPAASFEATG